MESYRCVRCQAVLSIVAIAPSESGSMLCDPLLERRLLAAAGAHALVCPQDNPVQN